MEMAYCVVFADGGVYRPAVRSAESECTGYAHSPYRIQTVGVLDYQPFYRKLEKDMLPHISITVCTKVSLPPASRSHVSIMASVCGMFS